LADAVIEALAGPGTSPGPGSMLEQCERRAAQGDLACREFLAVTSQLPQWADASEHRLGRRMFERNGVLALLVGFTVLVDSYAGGKDNKVLMMSGRLRSGSAFRRLVETAAFVSSVVGPDALRPGGAGHRAILAVRLLHAKVRVHCRRGGYDVAKYDQPVNQEAMCGTLMLFSSGVTVALEKLGAHVSAAEKESYHRLWRTAGWLLGVDEQLLPPTYAGERELFERLKAHSYWPDQDSRELFEAAVEGVAHGARSLPAGLQLLGGGLLRSERFLREFTRYCVDPRLGDVLVDGADIPARVVLEGVRTGIGLLSTVQRVPGLRGAAHRLQARVFHGVIESLLRGRAAAFDDPGFRPAALAR
jgi:hypothetical protein